MKKLLALLFCLISLSGLAEGTLAAWGAHALYVQGSTLWAWGSNHMGESDPASRQAAVTLPVKLMENAVSVACGRQFSLCLDADGKVWIWGNIPMGLLDGASGRAEEMKLLAEHVSRISACEESLTLIYESGQGRYFVSGTWFELGDCLDAACGADFALYLNTDGEAWFIGNPDYLPSGSPTPCKLADGAAYAAAGGQTGMIVSEDGRLYVFGASGTEGRLGLDTDEWIFSPTQNGVINALAAACGPTAGGAVTQDGGFCVWGALYSYFTGFDESGAPAVSVADDVLINYGKTPVTLIEGVRAIAFGDAFWLAETADGHVLCCGSNDWGQMGDGSITVFEILEEDDEDGGTDYAAQVCENNQHVFFGEVIIGE
ncbi:MAG: hypothetical protein IKI24_06330 [Clostridia bacterium]|nr:hypothetical protein [Clostridia bacterium]